MSGEIQSIVFDKDKFDTKKARAFLKRNKFMPIKRVDIKVNTLRYRIRTPKRNYRFRTKDLKEGVSAVFQFKK